MLDHNEAHDFLVHGKLPDNFEGRLAYWCERKLGRHCTNCDGVRDMNCVFRQWWEDEPSWCPMCCDDQGRTPEERSPELQERIVAPLEGFDDEDFL